MENEEKYKNKRMQLVEDLKRRGIIKTEKVYEAMRKVPRHKFIPEELRTEAYVDSPLRIGHKQTISAPHMNAMMCESLDLEKNQKVLEVGTGSGYHAALISEILGEKGELFTIERIPELGKKASSLFENLGYNNIKVVIGDGSLGYPERAPYDRILVTAACPKIIKALKKQLSKNEGKMCLPVGKSRFSQKLYLVIRKNDKFEKKILSNVVFVPLIGEKGF